MGKLIITAIFSLALFIQPAQLACEISRNEAELVATIFLSKKTKFDGIDSYKSISIDDLTIIHIFNFIPEGFVLTSADKRFPPILAWSSEGEFSPDDIPESCSLWLKWYKQQISDGLKNPNLLIGKHWDWEIILADDFENKTTTVQPLLTAKWDQGKFYNAMCPQESNGTDGHTPVGCVATAMAQLLYYYRFPMYGNGLHSYIPPYNNGVYGVQVADFGNTFYRWDEMVDQCFTYNDAVAELSYHCAVSVNMNFNPTSSGASTSNVGTALINYFNYAPSAQIALRSSAGNYENWRQMLVSNLDNNQPVIYFSSSGVIGHAYVCDGYSDSVYFHFNWGWSGNHNGYYYINELIPGGIDLTPGQGGVFNIYPDTTAFTYPQFCQENQNQTSINGSLTDGSGPLNYLPETNCSWLIKPYDPSITTIRLDFSLLDLHEGADFLQVFDGESNAEPLIGSFTGTTLPPVITSSQPMLFLQLETGSAETGKGFHANYHSYALPFCQGMEIITSPTGYLDDGSDFFDYGNNMDCGWLFAPEVPVYDSIETMNIQFTKFSLLLGDTLYVHDGPDALSPIMAALSGNSLPQQLTSTGQHFFLNFRTNETDSTSGWEIKYCGAPPVYCTDTAVLTESFGIIEDGSGDKHYNANTFCHWKIQVPEAEFVTIEFTKVDMELNYDYVLIRDLNKPYSAPVRITGNTIPPPFTISSNRVLITFFSDHLKNQSGWELQYHASAESIDSRFLHHFTVYPNPVTDVLIIRRKNNEMKDFTCTIFDLQGKELFTNQQAFSELALNLKNFQKGVYLLEINVGQQIIHYKIIKL